MITTVACHRLPVRATALDLADTVPTRLVRYFRQVRRIAWRAAARPLGQVEVAVQVSAASGRYAAHATADTLAGAFQAVVARIALQRRRRKRMRLGARRTAGPGR